MSLKAFHIVFILMSTLLSVGFCWWMLRSYSATGAVSELVMGILSGATAVGLVVYGRYFLKKLKRISYL